MPSSPPASPAAALSENLKYMSTFESDSDEWTSDAGDAAPSRGLSFSRRALTPATSVCGEAPGRSKSLLTLGLQNHRGNATKPEDAGNKPPSPPPTTSTAAAAAAATAAVTGRTTTTTTTATAIKWSDDGAAAADQSPRGTLSSTTQPIPIPIPNQSHRLPGPLATTPFPAGLNNNNNNNSRRRRHLPPLQRPQQQYPGRLQREHHQSAAAAFRAALENERNQLRSAGPMYDDYDCDDDDDEEEEAEGEVEGEMTTTTTTTTGNNNNSRQSRRPRRSHAAGRGARDTDWICCTCSGGNSRWEFLCGWCAAHCRARCCEADGDGGGGNVDNSNDDSQGEGEGEENGNGNGNGDGDGNGAPSSSRGTEKKKTKIRVVRVPGFLQWRWEWVDEEAGGE